MFPQGHWEFSAFFRQTLRSFIFFLKLRTEPQDPPDSPVDTSVQSFKIGCTPMGDPICFGGGAARQLAR